jgi:CheY-like chemotaxis protein
MVTGSERTRSMYAEYLDWRGVEVREAHSAAEAIRDIVASRPDVVATEERLPDSTGQELVRTLRRSRATFDLPVVLLCSDAFAPDTDIARASNYDLVLMVPLLPEALLDALRSVVAECAERRDEHRFESWLFVRGGESVWMVRPSDCELLIAGPGGGRGVYMFSVERELLAFQAEYERRLRHTGFALEEIGGDRRSGADRRRTPRPGAGDRRAVQ